MASESLKILIVEDSKFFSTAIRNRLSELEGIESFFATNYHDAKEFIIQNDGDFFIALLDLCLPDAPDGEIVELTHQNKIPSIIFSGQQVRDNLDYYYGMGVIDYVLKESPASLDYTISLIRRLLLNRQINILVVEDSTTARKILCEQLSRQQINVIEAENGQVALNKMAQGRNIHLVMTDYNMPEIDGYSLINRLRLKYSKDQLPIIGMSSHDNSNCAIRFLKLGANDFIHKPFSYEELLCRVSQNLDIYNLIEELKVSVYMDSLTGLHNRRYMLEHVEELFISKEKNKEKLVVAMIDVDHFKNINDTYGHHVGDDILIKLSENMMRRINNKDVVARFGGEEFCLLIQDRELDDALVILEKLRQAIAEDYLEFKEEKIGVTVSIGVCSERKGDFSSMLKMADNALYKAKNKGRNCVVQAE